MYRIKLYCALFPGDRYGFEELEDMDDDTIQKIERQRTAVLNEYLTDELLQLYSVLKFMKSIFATVTWGGA